MEQMAIWKTVPRKLLEHMDTAAFNLLSDLIENGPMVDIQILLAEQEKLRWLKNLRRTVKKTQKNLRETNNHEALASRKREFEQAQILLE